MVLTPAPHAHWFAVSGQEEKAKMVEELKV
jgi:hypothetical protein